LITVSFSCAAAAVRGIPQGGQPQQEALIGMVETLDEAESPLIVEAPSVAETLVEDEALTELLVEAMAEALAEDEVLAERG
jgi:hypothetical protein